MKILLASSEVHPYSKTGGLADMVGALGKALSHAGQEARIVTPLYRGIRERFPKIKREDWEFNLPLGSNRVQAELFSLGRRKKIEGLFHSPAIFLRSRRILFGERHQLRGQRRAVHFFLEVRCASGAVSAMAAGNGPRSRLAGGVGAGVDFAPKTARRVGERASDLPDDS